MGLGLLAGPAYALGLIKQGQSQSAPGREARVRRLNAQSAAQEQETSGVKQQQIQRKIARIFQSAQQARGNPQSSLAMAKQIKADPDLAKAFGENGIISFQMMTEKGTVPGLEGQLLSFNPGDVATLGPGPDGRPVIMGIKTKAEVDEIVRGGLEIEPKELGGDFVDPITQEVTHRGARTLSPGVEHRPGYRAGAERPESISGPKKGSFSAVGSTGLVLNQITGKLKIENQELFDKVGQAGAGAKASDYNRWFDLIEKNMAITRDSLAQFVTTETTDETILIWTNPAFELGMALMKTGIDPDQAMVRAAKLARAAWEAGDENLLVYLQRNNMTEDAQALLASRQGRPEPISEAPVEEAAVPQGEDLNTGGLSSFLDAIFGE